MAKLVWTGAKYYVDGADLSSYNNQIEWDHTFEMKETTTFGSNGAREYIGGLESTAITAAGPLASGASDLPDDLFWGQRRTVSARTVGPNNTAAVASVAFMTKALWTSIKRFGAVGDVIPWNETSTGSWPVARGKFVQASSASITADGDGTAVELSAVGSTQRLYAAMHVLAVSGTNPTLDVTIESDADSDFGSATTQLTFTQATAVGSQIIRTSPGVISDTFFRASFDIGGTDTPSFTVAIAVGIA